MIKPYKWQYAVMMLAPIATAFYPSFYNYSTKLLVDIITSTSSFSYKDVLYPIALFLSTQLFINLVWRVAQILEWTTEPKVRKNIITKSYDYVQHHSYDFFLNNFPGNISSKLRGILDGYDQLWESFHHGVTITVLTNIINMTVLFLVSKELGLFMLIWSIAFFAVIYPMSKKMNHYSFEETQARHRLVGVLADKISNISTLLSFATRKVELKDLEENIDKDFMPRQITLYRYDFIVQFVAGVFYLVMFTSLLFMMLEAKKNGLISIGDFVFVFGVSFSLSENLWKLITLTQFFVAILGDFVSSFEFLNTPHQFVDEKNAKDLVIKKGEIELDNLCFSYISNKPVFSNLSIKIKNGEKIGIVGHSGSGKSTLIHLILRYFALDEGKIIIDGQNIANVRVDSIREKIAVIPQDSILFNRNIIENIRYGNPKASDQDVIKASKKAHIHDDIVSLPEGYNTMVGDKGFKLSGGQRQRIAIARAILKDAPILVLDEATSSLDSETERQIQESLNVLIEDKNKTVVAIAHRLSTLKNMDRIIVLDKGQIIEEGTHKQLLSRKNTLYKQLWKLQKI
jgi:ATP-binding cassette, subfamily B, bacterial